MSRRMGKADPATCGAATRDGDQSSHMLAAYLESSTTELLGTIRLYVAHVGLASGPDATAAALDVLQETAAEALAHAARFDPSRSPSAWLLGIAVNVVKRRVTEEATRRRRELHVLGKSGADTGATGGADDTSLEATLATPDPPPDDTLADAEASAALLALVAEDDAAVLRLALIEECDAAALAQRLGITPGTARMRLHRALRRLRAAWLAQAPGSAGAADGRPPRGGQQ